MGIRYSEEFKLNAIKRCMEYGLNAAQAARELGVNANTMRQWLRMYKQNPTEPFVGSGNLHEEDQQIREYKKRIRDLEEENEILKKAAAIFAANRKR